MKSANFDNIKTFSKKIGLALPLALVISAPAVFAQATFDTTTLAAETSVTNSNGATGDANRTSYRTGEAPGSSGLSGNTTSRTGPQLYGPMGSPALNGTYLGGLAPVFGMGVAPNILPGISFFENAGGTNLNLFVGSGGQISGNANFNVGGTNVNVSGTTSVGAIESFF
jgi:hypothetical protein